MKLIIAGTRTFTDYQLLCTECKKILDQVKFEVVSGCAKGADLLGERFAKDHELFIHRFPAEWEKHGKRAGFIRNEDMAKFANALLAFWDGNSKGTKHMIDLAKKNKLYVKVIRYDS